MNKPAESGDQKIDHIIKKVRNNRQAVDTKIEANKIIKVKLECKTNRLKDKHNTQRQICNSNEFKMKFQITI